MMEIYKPYLKLYEKKLSLADTAKIKTKTGATVCTKKISIQERRTFLLYIFLKTYIVEELLRAYCTQRDNFFTE